MPPRSQSKTKEARTQPKIKGCYECSQRRISCDRGEPNCQKCISRGIQCSGLGIRYRFERGIASRGKHVGKTIQDVLHHEPGVFASGSSGLLLEQAESSSQDAADGSANPYSPDQSTPGQSDVVPGSRPIYTPSINLSHDFPLPQNQHQNLWPLEFSETGRQDDQPLRIWPPVLYDQPDIIPRWKDFLLSYWSDYIAPQMLSIDDASNGWRYMVLSVAVSDDVVNSATLAAAAYHASLKSSGFSLVAQRSYTKAIKGLQERRNLESHDKIVNCYNILTILILLTSAMVTGTSDFVPLFKMLKSAITTVGDEDGLGSAELSKFLVRQVRKFKVYAEPLVSEQDGINAVRSQALQSFECLQHCSVLHPEYSAGLHNVRSQIEQAYNIYLCRALDVNQDQSSSIRRVEQFKQTVEAYPKGCPGEHVLVWATFIAAAESLTPEHQTFFTERMMQLGRINGFGNTLKSLPILRSIWSGDADTKWTRKIAEAQMFIM